MAQGPVGGSVAAWGSVRVAPMARRCVRTDRGRALLLAGLVILVALAGCLGAEDGASPGVPAPDGPTACAPCPLSGDQPASTEVALAALGSTISVSPWFAPLPVAVAVPDLDRLVRLAAQAMPPQDAWFAPDEGVVVSDGPATWLGANAQASWFFDGSAFVVAAGLSDADLEAPAAMLLARVIDVETGATVAQGAMAREGTWLGGDPWVLPLRSFEGLRMQARYSGQLVWAALPAESAGLDPSATAAFSWLTNDPSARVGGFEVATLDAPDNEARAVVTLPVRPLMQWESELPLRARADVSITGPAEGIDRPDAVEQAPNAEPATGAYEVRVEGRRIWQAALLVELDDSRVAATSPETFSNGSKSVEAYFVGYRSLDSWLAAGVAGAVDVSMRLTVWVDWETGQDLAAHGEQRFLATLLPGYRVMGQTFAADSAGDDLVVHVRAEPGLPA